MNWHRAFARMMAILGMSLKEIEDMSLAQFLLYSVEAYEIEKQRSEGGGGARGKGYSGGGNQSFRGHM